MFATCILAAILLAPAGSEAAPDPGGAKTQATAAVGVLWIRAGSLPYDPLAEEIRLRLPEIRLAAYGDTPPQAPAGTLTVFVDVRAAPGTPRALALTLIASDGRAYDRVVEPDAEATSEDTHELVARNVANLVFGIESGTVPPDRADVPMPQPEVRREPCPVCPSPMPAPPAAAPVRAPRIPRVEIGPSISFGTLTGLGPPTTTDRFAAWSGELDLGVRWRSGGVFVVGLRVAGRGHPRGPSILRFRTMVGGGYAWRPREGAFELAALAGVAVEPWLVLEDGDRVDFGAAELPTLGGWARLAPGWLVRSESGSIAARIGAFAELDIAYAPSADGIVAVSDQEGPQLYPMFRVGGPELAFGLQARLWFPVW